MKIIIRNNANVPKKYLRLFSWKLRKLNRKFDRLLYSEVHIKSEGNNPTTYLATVRHGIPGNDIILSNKSQDPLNLFNSLIDKTKLSLGKASKQNYPR